jgi:hypothetical protein
MPLRANGQDALGHRDLHVLGRVHAGQFRLDHVPPACHVLFHPHRMRRHRSGGHERPFQPGEDVGLEGANSSFQIHLRVDPADFTRTYNAVQLATAPALAVSGNSATLLGHRLWEETRIAVFKQSVDDRQGVRRRPARTALDTGWLRGGALELFTESVRLHRPLLPVLGDLGRRPDDAGRQAPPLDELRLHQGTVWRWNRAIRP